MVISTKIVSLLHFSLDAMAWSAHSCVFKNALNPDELFHILDDDTSMPDTNVSEIEKMKGVVQSLANEQSSAIGMSVL